MTILKTNAAAAKVSVERLSQAVEYNGETGSFVWKTRPVEHFEGGLTSAEVKAQRWNGKYAGRPAFTCVDPRGYSKGMIDQKMVWAHRVALALRDGEWPQGEVDHINRNKRDNRIQNLRVVTHQQNAMNRVQGGKPGARA